MQRIGPFDGNLEAKLSCVCDNLKHNLKVYPLLREYRNYKMSATDEIQRLPDEGEIIIVTVRQVTGHGAYVTLDGYNNMTGFLHISEIATGWIRNIERYVRPKQKAVLKVIRVNKVRGEVDTSLKQVSAEERKSKLIEVKKNDKAATFFDFIKAKLKLTDQQVQEIEDRVLQKYDYVYDAFEAVTRKGLDAIQNIDLSPEIKNAIEEASRRIPIPLVEISGIMEITSKKPDGIEIIKNMLANAEGNKGSASSTITYIGAPRYRIVVTGENFKVAEKFMNNTVEKMRASIEKQHGTFDFVRQDSKKSHTLQQA
jgi:translation initiation factor 2 subunit 1